MNTAFEVKRAGVIFLLVLTTGLSGVAQTVSQSRRYDAFFLEAICERAKGNNDAAFDLLRRCVEIDSMKSEAYYYLSQYYGALKQKERAMACIEKAAALEPMNSTYQETLANAYVNLRQYDQAVLVLERLYDQHRDRDDVLGILVQLYEEQHDYEAAIKTLAKLETIEGKSERLSYAKSNFYTQLGNKKAAIAEMKNLADQYPNDQNYRGLYANTLFVNGQKKKALEIYDDILRIEPENRNALMALLAYEKDEGDPDKADALTEKVLLSKNITSQDRILLMRQEIGQSEQEGGDSTRVLYLFRRMLEQPQMDADVAILCATYMNLKKMPNDSISRVLEQVLQVAPDNAAARLQLVSYAWQAENMDRIISLCKDARQYNPDEMAFYYYQGIAYYKQEQLDDALDAFQNGISVINQQSDTEIVSDFYAVMGDILHQKGLDKEAFAAYDSCLTWKDDNYGCLNNYAYYLSEKELHLDKAEQMSYRAIKAEPKNATYLDTYAWILFKEGRYAEAKIYIDQTLQCDSDSSAVLLEHAGDIYYHTGDHERALAYWQQALAKASPKPEPGSEDRRQILTRKIKLKKYLKE
ncbi:MAG: tetratricopeptide repeat protein [Prevotella sp.]|nr:tetratricopeptide repeat protein [Prevotella sp.]